MPILPSLRFKTAALCLALLMALAGAHGAGASGQQTGNDDNQPSLEPLVITGDSGKHRFRVEVARTRAQQRKGLMHRDKLAADRGMLFVFQDTRIRSFWMKNTNIPLDMLFIAKDGKIRHIHHNAKPNSRKNISSQSPVRAVLEINGRLARKYDIEKGDTVHHAIFGNTLAP